MTGGSMKKLKLFALMIVAGLMFAVGSSAKAEIGYIDYQRVLENYPAAQQAVKDIDAKTLELQQYMLEQEKQYKNLSTPLQKQNFENLMVTKCFAVCKFCVVYIRLIPNF